MNHIKFSQLLGMCREKYNMNMRNLIGLPRLKLSDELIVTSGLDVNPPDFISHIK